MIPRRKTRQVLVGDVPIGGGEAIVIQSMTNTMTHNVDATVKQIHALAKAGARIVRVAVPTRKDTAVLKEIVAQSPVPVVADVHFHFERAMEAIAAGVHKIRLNPGNLRDRAKVRAVIDAARDADIAIRIGVNAGSIRTSDELTRKFSEKQMIDLMLAELTSYVTFFEKAKFEKLVLSAKSADTLLTITLYQALAKTFDYPLHVGLTHSGTVATGSIRSAATLGVLLHSGIGDTIRISLAGDPVKEIHAATELLASMDLIQRDTPELIVCPTCGRTQVDLVKIADRVERKLASIKKRIKVAVMGCVVNGPGEAADANIALIAGCESGFIYRDGQRVVTLPAEELVDALICEVKAYDARD